MRSLSIDELFAKPCQLEHAVDGGVVAHESEADAGFLGALAGTQDHRDRGRVEKRAALDIDQERSRFFFQRFLSCGDPLVAQRCVEVTLDLNRVDAVADRLPPDEPIRHCNPLTPERPHLTPAIFPRTM